MYKLVLLRHGESTWNKENRFTGWTDVDLVGEGRRGGDARPAELLQGRRLRLRRRLHVGAQARHPHALDRARRAGPDVDPRAPRLAAQRAALRRAAGPEQGRDRREVRRGAGEDLAAQLRHPAAGARRRTTRATRATTRATRGLDAGRAAAHRVPEGHGRALPAVLARDHRAGGAERASACSSPRTATACARW